MISQEEFEEIVVKGLKRDISSNEDQRKAILARPDKSLFLVAGPGSGKTTVMVLKILKFIFVDDIKPEEIFATTFTRKAAEELYSRILGWGDEIKNYIIDERGDDFEIIEKVARIDLNQINVGTIDKLSEDVMRKNKEPGQNQPVIIENFVANSAMIKILTEEDRYKDTHLQEFLKPLIKKEKIDEPSKMSEKILEIKDRIYQDKVDINVIYDNCENEGMKKALECIREYEKILRQRNTLDFTMLESRFLKQLKENSLNSLNNVKIVLVDEYQDTNLIQEDIYFTIAGIALKNNGSITVVGDDDQSLYRFRGATVDLFTNYKKRVKDKLGIDVEEINLKTNYRSTENIIKHCNKFVELDGEYQNARVNNKPKIIAPDFDKDKMPVLGLFRNNLEMLSIDLSRLISKLVNKGEVQLKVLKVLDEDYYRKVDGNVDIAQLQQINHQKELEGKKIERITLKLDGEYGSASDIAILSYSPKERQIGGRSLLYFLRKHLKDQKEPIEVFNPRGIELQNVDIVGIFCGLILECIDPEARIQISDKTIPNLAKVNLNRWRVKAREYIKLNPEPHEPLTLSDFVIHWQNRIPRGSEKWPKTASLMELAYKLITWIDELQEDVEGIVYLEAITKSITQTGFFSKYYSNISFANKQKERESILEALWNIFIPLSTGGIQIDESLLETLPEDRINVLSIHQSKGLEFPLVIVDVGSKFKDISYKTQSQRFPKKPPENMTIEDMIRQYSELGISKRSEVDRSFDDLTRLYFVAFSRAESVLLLVGLNPSIQGYKKKDKQCYIPNVAVGWSRDERYIGFNEIYLI